MSSSSRRGDSERGVDLGPIADTVLLGPLPSVSGVKEGVVDGTRRRDVLETVVSWEYVGTCCTAGN